MAASDVGEQGAMGGGRRRRRQNLAQPFGCREAAGEEPDRRRFHVALAASDLPREAQTRLGPEPQALVEEHWRVEEGVAVQPAEARELGLRQARNGAEDAHLRA